MTDITKHLIITVAIAGTLMFGATVIESSRSAGNARAEETQTVDMPTTTELEVIETTTTTTTLPELDLSFLNTPVTVAPPAPRTTPVPEPDYDPGDGSRWDKLAQCESGGNWATNTGNGFGGGLQFMHGNGYSTWLSFGGGEFAADPWNATREQQIVVAERVLASSGWGAWPGCTRKFGWT